MLNNITQIVCPPNQTCFSQEATQSGYMMTPGGQYRQNTMPQVYRNYIDGGASGGAGGQQRRFKNLEDIVCFKVGSDDKVRFGSILPKL